MDGESLWFYGIESLGGRPNWVNYDFGRGHQDEDLDSRFELELVDDLDWRQRYPVMRSSLDVYLGRDAVSNNLGDQSGELIADRRVPRRYWAAGRGV